VRDRSGRAQALRPDVLLILQRYLYQFSKRSRRRITALVFAAYALTSVFGCTRGGEPDGPQSRVRIAVGSLELTGVSDVCYRITVENASTNTVWQKSGICADSFGDGIGGIAYVGPCDASDNDNVVRLEIEDDESPEHHSLL